MKKRSKPVIEVVYYSRGGRTRKVAEKIASVCGVVAKDMKKDVVVNDFDLLFVGSGNYGGQPASEITDFLNVLKDVKGRRAAVFGTYGGGEDAINVMKSMLEGKGIQIAGTWGCKGRFTIMNRGRPNEEDLANAERFADEIIGNSLKTNST